MSSLLIRVRSLRRPHLIPISRKRRAPVYSQRHPRDVGNEANTESNGPQRTGEIRSGSQRADPVRYGYEAAGQYRGLIRWTDVEEELRARWEKDIRDPRRPWKEVRLAVREGWDRRLKERAYVVDSL